MIVTKNVCKITLGVDMSKIYEFGQNLRGTLHDTVQFLEKMSLKICLPKNIRMSKFHVGKGYQNEETFEICTL